MAALQGAIGQASPRPQADPEALTQAFYRARAAGDEEASRALFRGLREQGATLRSPTQDELQALSSAQGAANGLGSNAQNFAAGQGKSVFDNARGLAQSAIGTARLAMLPTSISANIGGYDDNPGDTLGAAYDNLKSQQSEANQRDSALMGTKAGIAGNISGQVLQAVAAGTALKGAGLSRGVLP